MFEKLDIDLKGNVLIANARGNLVTLKFLCFTNVVILPTEWHLK